MRLLNTTSISHNFHLLSIPRSYIPEITETHDSTKNHHNNFSPLLSVCDTRAEPAGNGDRPLSLLGGDGHRRHHGERGPCDILPLVGAANLQLHQKRARPSPQALGESVSLIATLIVYFAAAPFLFT